MNISDRIKTIRKENKLSQAHFGERLGVSRDVINDIENERVAPKELFIRHLCTVFNISEDWLRNGQGSRELQSDTFSLDKYIKDRKLSDLEFEIVKCYFELDKDTRGKILEHFKKKFNIEIRPDTGEIAMTDDERISSSVAEAEEKYIKNVSKNVPKTEHIALNSIEEGRAKENV